MAMKGSCALRYFKAILALKSPIKRKNIYIKKSGFDLFSEMFIWEGQTKWVTLLNYFSVLPTHIISLLSNRTWGKLTGNPVSVQATPKMKCDWLWFRVTSSTRKAAIKWAAVDIISWAKLFKESMNDSLYFSNERNWQNSFDDNSSSA